MRVLLKELLTGRIWEYHGKCITSCFSKYRRNEGHSGNFAKQIIIESEEILINKQASNMLLDCLNDQTLNKKDCDTAVESALEFICSELGYTYFIDYFDIGKDFRVVLDEYKIPFLISSNFIISVKNTSEVVMYNCLRNILRGLEVPNQDDFRLDRFAKAKYIATFKDSEVLAEVKYSTCELTIFEEFYQYFI